MTGYYIFGEREEHFRAKNNYLCFAKKHKQKIKGDPGLYVFKTN